MSLGKMSRASFLEIRRHTETCSESFKGEHIRVSVVNVFSFLKNNQLIVYEYLAALPLSPSRRLENIVVIKVNDMPVLYGEILSTSQRHNYIPWNSLKTYSRKDNLNIHMKTCKGTQEHSHSPSMSS